MRILGKRHQCLVVLLFHCARQDAKRTVADCDAFLWNPHQKLVIFDVDGTITKSDVVGYVESVYLNTFTHHHSGVCQFLNQLHRHNYQVLYLTSRPIEAIHCTRLLLTSIIEDTTQLPRGPLFTNTLRAIKALYQEVWAGGSGAFKTGVLRGICDLYVSAGVPRTPFIAGFGNRVTDIEAYKSAGVLEGMLFLIAPNSIVRVYQPEPQMPCADAMIMGE